MPRPPSSGRERDEPAMITGMLDPAVCAVLRGVIDRAPESWAQTSTQVSAKFGFEADLARRRVKLAAVPPWWSTLIRARLTTLAPELARRFAVDLHEIQSPQFLRYEPGHFYTRHRDISPLPGTAEAARKLSVVLHLGDARAESHPTNTDGWYSGGVLRVLDGARTHEFVGRCATAVAFLAGSEHEVTPVVAGVRHVVVAWYA